MAHQKDYIQPNIRTIAIHIPSIMAASAIPVSENGDADAKRNNMPFMEETEEDDDATPYQP